jgi:biotin carboxylase
MMGMTVATVWFNRGQINLRRPLRIIRAAMRPGEFRIVSTHSRRSRGLAGLADAFEVEPRGVSEDEYVRWCLDFARRQRVTLFVPGRNVLALVRARDRFEAGGTRLLAAANADMLAALRSKVRQYALVGAGLVSLPRFAVFHNVAEFDAAWARLRPRHAALCYKPAASVYGIGFRIVADTPKLLARHRAGDPLTVTLDESRRELAGSPARGIDCLARDGELIRCVVRRKPLREVRPQRIEHHPAVEAVARGLTARLRLNGIFNIQLRDDRGQHYLLEINPRMSGGVRYSCRSGLALPYWALRLALGTATADDVPLPRTGILVSTSERVTSR